MVGCSLLLGRFPRDEKQIEFDAILETTSTSFEITDNDNIRYLIKDKALVLPPRRTIEQQVEECKPESALFSGADYADLCKIIQQAPKYLSAQDILLIEYGFDQVLNVRSCFSNSHFQRVKTLKDLQQHERVTYGVSIRLPDQD